MSARLLLAEGYPADTMVEMWRPNTDEWALRGRLANIATTLMDGESSAGCAKCRNRLRRHRTKKLKETKMDERDLQLMPWKRDLMTDDELRQWLASREEAGSKIDVETCEIGCWYAGSFDPYGVREGLGDLSPELDGYIDKFNFVRSPESSGWVCEVICHPIKATPSTTASIVRRTKNEETTDCLPGPGDVAAQHQRMGHYEVGSGRLPRAGCAKNRVPVRFPGMAATNVAGGRVR